MESQEAERGAEGAVARGGEESGGEDEEAGAPVGADSEAEGEAWLPALVEAASAPPGAEGALRGVGAGAGCAWEAGSW